jgi:hypothetical protein
MAQAPKLTSATFMPVLPNGRYFIEHLQRSEVWIMNDEL